MIYLLDTNICSAYLKQPGKLAHRFLQNLGNLSIPTVVAGELFTWAYRRPEPARLLNVIERDLLVDVLVYDYCLESSRTFGELRATMLSQGIVVNPVDLMIAAVAITRDATLITHNIKHFEVIPGLRIEDWLEA